MHQNETVKGTKKLRGPHPNTHTQHQKKTQSQKILIEQPIMQQVIEVPVLPHPTLSQVCHHIGLVHRKYIGVSQVYHFNSSSITFFFVCVREHKFPHSGHIIRV